MRSWLSPSKDWTKNRTKNMNWTYMGAELVGSMGWTHDDFKTWKGSVLDKMDTIEGVVVLDSCYDELQIVVDTGLVSSGHTIKMLKFWLREITEETFKWLRGLNKWPNVNPSCICRDEDHPRWVREIAMMFFTKGNKWPKVPPTEYAVFPGNVVRFRNWFSEDTRVSSSTRRHQIENALHFKLTFVKDLNPGGPMIYHYKDIHEEDVVVIWADQTDDVDRYCFRNRHVG